MSKGSEQDLDPLKVDLNSLLFLDLIHFQPVFPLLTHARVPLSHISRKIAWYEACPPGRHWSISLCSRGRVGKVLNNECLIEHCII